MRARWLSCLLVLMLFALQARAEGDAAFEIESLPALPVNAQVDHVVKVGVSGEQVLVFIDQSVYVMNAERSGWTEAGSLEDGRIPAAAVGSTDGVYCIGGVVEDEPSSTVTRVRWNTITQELEEVKQSDTPVASSQLAAAMIDSTIYLTDGASVWTFEPGKTVWEPLAVTLSKSIEQPALVSLQKKLYLIGKAEDGYAAFRYDPQHKADVKTWKPIAPPEVWPAQPAGVPFGLSHILFFKQLPDSNKGEVFAYHAITDTWITLGQLDVELSPSPAVALLDGRAILIDPDDTKLIKPAQLQTNYGWLDNLVVAAYLLGMVGVGWYFTKRENSSNDFFRGGQRIPWWAAGMSLFATGASAISLAGMPGMGFGTDWTYFTISICSAMCLPIGIFIMAPLVRRLNISTANEYLERRFGVISRLFASTIFMFTQVASRIASVMLLSAIALEAITDMNIMTAIIVMGVVTTIYTYLGGLEAVIWTDTIQGFVMVTTVVGCLILALMKLDMPISEMWSTAEAYDKFHMFDFPEITSKEPNLLKVWIGPTTFIFMIHTLFLTFGGISDQNFVQRVQSTPDLKQTKMAVATQMAVAVPINILLFSLGTALWLFYRAHPDSLSPTIVNNDGVFPFFAAQQLPIGVSGIVVAALLAATMSTVSSSICAVSDLGTNDFYRRFKTDATDHQCLILGRILTAVVGASGTIAAMVLAGIEDVKSVWDLAIMVTGLISSSVLGLFMLGLLTRKTHEVGALIGAVAGMTTIILLKNFSDITFWLYIVIGPIVTISVGTIMSLILPGKAKETRGLTLYSLAHAEESARASAK